MKQKSIFALVLGAILVLTLSGIDNAFADYDDSRDDDRYDDDSRDDDKDDSDDKSEKEKRSQK